jgi:hypothetical protein
LKSVAVVCLLLLVGTAWGDAGDLELARKRFEMGRLLHERGRYQEALVELEAARALVPRPEFDYNIALCLQRLDRPGEAADAFERFLDERAGDPEAPALRQRIASLRAQAQARVQPQPETKTETPQPKTKTETPQPKTTPETPETKTIPPATATEPKPTTPPITTETKPITPARPRFLSTPRGRATVALAAAGGALLLTAAVTGAVALDGRSSYDAGCDAGACDRAAFDRMHAFAIATDVLIGVGAAAGVTAIVLAATRPRARAFAVVPLAGGAPGLAVAGVF